MCTLYLYNILDFQRYLAAASGDDEGSRIRGMMKAAMPAH